MIEPHLIRINEHTIVILTLTDIFGKSYKIRGRIHGIKYHGYNNPSGSWSLTPICRGSKPALFVIVKKINTRKKLIRINSNRIEYIEYPLEEKKEEENINGI